jgi:hypothetical protein
MTWSIRDLGETLGLSKTFLGGPSMGNQVDNNGASETYIRHTLWLEKGCST